MILITGATGHLGSAVIETLLKRLPATQIAAFVRDSAKAADLQAQGISVRVGSYDDTASLDEAMSGVEKVLLISGDDADNGLQQHQNVVDAAKKAGVKWIAYTGRSLKDRSTLVNALMNRHFLTEDYIRASGLGYVLFRNVLYMDALPQFVGGDKVFDTGIHLPAGDGKVAFALRSELGEAIANILAGGDCENKTYDFAGTESYSFHEVAAALSELSGTEVKYAPVEASAFEAQMRGRGVPETMIPRMVGFITDIKAGQESRVSPDLQNILGRNPTTLKEGLKQLFHL